MDRAETFELAAPRRRWVVAVNEVGLAAHGTPQARDWWLHYRATMDRVGRTIVRQATIPGDIVWLRCDGLDEAGHLARLLVERGLPKQVVQAALVDPDVPGRDR